MNFNYKMVSPTRVQVYLVILLNNVIGTWMISFVTSSSKERYMISSSPSVMGIFSGNGFSFYYFWLFLRVCRRVLFSFIGYAFSFLGFVFFGLVL